MATSEPVISLRAVGKRYRLGTRPIYRTLREQVTALATAPWRRLRTRGTAKRAPAELIWALKDLSLDIHQGEVVGIIGRNGAGKSTLLKILSRITAVTEGEVRLHGRIGSLLEVGTGFHPELTGRENIFLNGAILGMRRAEIRRRFDAIVDFAEIPRFLDTPVKHYSSGMYMRLAFSVAAHLDPEILLIDEVLAVGDAEFQRKCLGKMSEVSRQGRTVLFVSHNMAAIGALTSRCILLKSGRLDSFLPTPEAVAGYFRQCEETRVEERGSLDAFRRGSASDRHVTITALSAGESGDALPCLKLLADLTVVIDVNVRHPLAGASVTLRIKNRDGVIVSTLFSWDYHFSLTASPGLARITVRMPKAPFTPGRYLCDVGINQSPATNSFDVILDYPLFEIRNDGEVPHWPERAWGTTYVQEVLWSLDQNEGREGGGPGGDSRGKATPDPR